MERLTNDREDLLAVPQFIIYFVPKSRESPAEGLKTSCLTHAQHKDQGCLPGFLRLVFALQPPRPLPFLDWHLLKLDGAFVPMMEKDRRPVTRHAKSLLEASEQEPTKHQAFVLFKDSDGCAISTQLDGFGSFVLR